MTEPTISEVEARALEFAREAVLFSGSLGFAVKTAPARAALGAMGVDLDDPAERRAVLAVVGFLADVRAGTHQVKRLALVRLIVEAYDDDDVARIR